MKTFLTIVMYLFSNIYSKIYFNSTLNLYEAKNVKYLYMLQESVNTMSKKDFNRSAFILMDVINATLFTNYDRTKSDVLYVDCVMKKTGGNKALIPYLFVYQIVGDAMVEVMSRSNYQVFTTTASKERKQNLDLNKLYLTFITNALADKKKYRYLGGDEACYKTYGIIATYFDNSSFTGIDYEKIFVTCQLKELGTNHTISVGFLSDAITNDTTKIDKFSSMYYMDFDNKIVKGFNVSDVNHPESGLFIENSDRNKISINSLEYLINNSYLIPIQVDLDDNTKDEFLDNDNNPNGFSSGWIIFIIILLITLTTGGYFGYKYYYNKKVRHNDNLLTSN